MNDRRDTSDGPDALRRQALRRPTRAVLVATAAVVVAAVVGACGSTDARPATGSATSDTRPASSAPTTTPVEVASTNGFPSDWVAPALTWTGCDLPRGGECATLQVPLDWDDPSGPVIDLAMGRIPATGNRIGPLFMNPGGPGGSGLEYLSYDPFGAPISERFDIVSWDPRGVGSSTSVQCGDAVPGLQRADPDPDSNEEAAALDAAAESVSDECALSDAALLPHLGTADVARDVEAMRRALGSEPLNFVGFSYGTQIGQVYAEFFPTEIRTMVLDGVVDPTLGFTEFLIGQTRAFELAFEVNAAACAAAGEAVCGVGDLGAAYDEVLAMVELEPLAGGTAAVGPSALATAAIQTSYAPDGWRSLGPALATALDGNGAALWQLASSYYDFGGYTSYAAVVCIDSPPPLGSDAYREFADAARAVSPRFGGSVANEMLPCATWPSAAVGAPTAITAPGAPPILVVGNTGDAATPYENAVAVADQLESGVLVTADMGGHTAYGSNACVTDVVDAYLVDLTVPSADPRC